MRLRKIAQLRMLMKLQEIVDAEPVTGVAEVFVKFDAVCFALTSPWVPDVLIPLFESAYEFHAWRWERARWWAEWIDLTADVWVSEKLDTFEPGSPRTASGDYDVSAELHARQADRLNVGDAKKLVMAAFDKAMADNDEDRMEDMAMLMARLEVIQVTGVSRRLWSQIQELKKEFPCDS